jgi:hypothetical protein
MAKSTFPGMDPFLERQWRDVHLSLIAFSRGQLNRQLRPPLRATAKERVLVEIDDDEYRGRHPDVSVVEQSASSSGATVVTAPGTVASEVESYLIRLPSEPLTERFVQIVDVESGDRVVAVIEFLSPTNKLPGPNVEDYLAKRKEYLAGGVNIVEIDLNRAGTRERVLPVRHLPSATRGATYLACLRRASSPHDVEAFPIPLPARLPLIPIPLRPQDAEIRLDLQQIIDRAYEEGHHDMLDYTRPLTPPLGDVEAEFAARVLKEAGKR